MSKKSKEPTKEAPTAATPPKLAVVIPMSRATQITVEAFARGFGSLGESFIACERLENKTTRKFTQAEWRVIYNEWINRPRG